MHLRQIPKKKASGLFQNTLASGGPVSFYALLPAILLSAELSYLKNKATFEPLLNCLNHKDSESAKQKVTGYQQLLLVRC